VKISGSELQRFMDEAWPKPEDDWYWDQDVFDVPDPLATYDTDDIGPIQHQGRESDDPTGGDGYNLATLVKRWRKTRDCDIVTALIPKGKTEALLKAIADLGGTVQKDARLRGDPQ